MQGSVHSDVVRAVQEAARAELGVQAAPCLVAPPPTGRVPMQEALTMWEALAKLDDDGTLGARLGCLQDLERGVLSTLLNAARAQATLARAMRVVARYWALISTHAELIVEVREDDGERVFLLRSAYGVGARPTVVSQSTLMVLLRGLRRLTGSPTPILRVTLAAPVSPAVCRRLRPLFGAPVLGGVGVDSLVFPEAFASWALPRPRAASSTFDQAQAEALLPTDTASSFSDEVKKEIQLVFPSAPQIEAIAAALATSPRSLQRRLHGEGTSFRQLCVATRADIARGFLCAGGSVAEVAALLGYADATAFSRMYRKVFGHPPQRDRADVA